MSAAQCPETAEQLAALLGECATRNASMELVGHATKARCGARVRDAAVTISTQALRGVLEYEPRDLTVRVASGTLWRDFTATLEAERQMVPIDPPCFDTATVGGVVATNLSGPRRRLYGTARDMVIGMSVATLDGKLARAGGMVVKNVAGLDTQKALIGSYGTLAAMASVNFKLAPAPAATRTYLIACASAEEAGATRDRVLNSVLQPAAIDVLNPAAAAQCTASAYVVAIQAGASEAVLARYDKELPGAAKLIGNDEASFWRAVREFAPTSLDHGACAIVRVGHRISELKDVLASTRQACIARAGSGIAYLAFDTADALREWFASTEARGWSRLIEWSAPTLPQDIELWSAPGDDLAVMLRLKAMFDPHALLNAGRMHGRI